MFCRHNGLRLLRNMNDVAYVSLITGLVLLLAAAGGALINVCVGNWFQSSGLALVGLFYLAIFLGNFPPRGSAAIGAADVLPKTHPHESGPAAEDPLAADSELLVR